MLSRSSVTLGVLLGFGAVLNACGSSHTGALPFTSTAERPAEAAGARAAAVLPPSGDLVAIDCGGAASGGFAADADYSHASWTSGTTSAVSTVGIAIPAPQAVYQTERLGTSVTYAIPGFTPGGSYAVRLSFVETYFKAAGKRVFNVAIDGTQVLSNYDVFAASGGIDRAIAPSFATTADAVGTITISLNAITDNAEINAIEILPGTASPGPSGTPSPVASPTVSPSPGPSVSGIFIHSGGGAAGAFLADKYFVASGTYSSTTTATIATNGVTNPAPQAVYQVQRVGQSISYTIPGLAPGQTYAVGLDFAEHFWTAAGKRTFTIAINGSTALSSLDVFAAAGGEYKALSESFSTTATSAGTIAILLTATKDNAILNGIEITSPGTVPTSAPTTTPVPSSVPVTTPSPVPSPTGSVAFDDWPTYAYDNQHAGFNPNTTAFTPASLANLHAAWQVAVGAGYNEAQPIVATNVAGHAALVIVGTSSGNVVAYDATAGTKVWQTHLGRQNLTGCGILGVDGTARYDATTGSIYIAAGNDQTPNNVYLYQLNAASGAVTGSVDVTPTLLAGESVGGHTGVTLAGGLAYLGTGSACDNPSWRGRVAAVNVSTMTLASTFFTAYNVGPSPAPYSGGGVWGWGGVAVDATGNVYAAVGNAETAKASGPGQPQAPFVTTTNEQAGYSENIVKLSSDLSTVYDANYPGFNFTIGWGDLDFSGTPVVYQPAGCDPLVATQGKGGTLVVNDTLHLNPPNGAFVLSKPSATANYIGNPSYSPLTGLLYAPVSSSQGGALYAPGLAAITACGSSVMWNAQFGPDSFAYTGANPRSAPTVSAGGVVFIGTPCTNDGAGGCGTPGTLGGALWAVDANTGTVLGSGKPLLLTSDNIRMAPVVDGLWMWVYDESGNLYGLTIDPSVKAIDVVRRPRIARPNILWH